MKPIDIAHWRDTPCVSGEPATQDDVDAGRAVFVADGEPVELELPHLGIVSEEGVGEPTAVVLIQAERLDDGSIAIGYRLIDGGSGIADFDDVELVSEPDERFR